MLLLFFIAFVVCGFAVCLSAAELRVATWNIEWLRDGVGDENKRNYKGRRAEDYALLRKYADSLDADVVSFQEVENENAARMVFGRNTWRVFVSKRMHDQKTGFAIRNGIEVTRFPDVTLLDDRLRRGVDVEIQHDGVPVRMLSVHLKSGCFQNTDQGNPARTKRCARLMGQIPDVEEWIQDRHAEGVPFIIAGDWNRRIHLAGDTLWADLDDGDPGTLVLIRAGARQRGARQRGARQREAMCVERYSQFVDHIVAGSTGRWTNTFFDEVVYREDEKDRSRLSDHCPIVAHFSLD